MKKKRHSDILKIVQNNEIQTQDELLQELVKLGYDTTQATISRDINELRLIKATSKSGITRYAVQDGVSVKDARLYMINFFKESVTSLDFAMNTVVIKCQIGMAMAACARLDEVKIPNIVGTLAGDDTIFVLFKSEKEASDFASEINDIIFN